jgi:tryptophan-rich sensory protein
MRTIGAAIVGAVICVAIGASPAIVAHPDAWYAGLSKPAWTPPGPVFGIVWPVLYVMMGTAAGVVWTGGRSAERTWALALFAGQLVLNAAWTFLFFRFHRGGIALVEIVVLWGTIAMTTVAFARVRRSAAALMVPYLAWVTFAVGLNAAIWRLNG